MTKPILEFDTTFAVEEGEKYSRSSYGTNDKQPLSDGYHKCFELLDNIVEKSSALIALVDENGGILSRISF
jgi:hypothetical protein